MIYICSSVSLLFLIILIFLVYYRKIMKSNFNFLNQYPFELVIKKNKLCYYILFLLPFILLGVYQLKTYIITPSIHVNYFLSFIVGLAFILLDCFLYLMLIFNIEKSFKQFVINSVIASMLNIFILSYSFLYIFRSDNISYFYMIPISIILILFIAYVFLTSMKDSTKLINKINQENEIEYIKPKFNYLSSLHWFNIVVFYITTFIYFLFL